MTRLTPRTSGEAGDFSWWVCACVKGGSIKHRRPSTHIKMHPPTTVKCRKCGCTKAGYDALASKQK